MEHTHTHTPAHSHTQTNTFKNTHKVRRKVRSREGRRRKPKGSQAKGRREFLYDVTHCALELNDTSNTHISKKEKECRVHQKSYHSVAPPGTIPTRLHMDIHCFTRCYTSITTPLCGDLQVHTHKFSPYRLTNSATESALNVSVSHSNDFLKESVHFSKSKPYSATTVVQLPNK